ncbi:MAG TPA: alcohol dehydrogenase catalytic domain-containing protein [Peptococcaceae bacterium]|jgi:L-iditol 2-dehydrogenase|nr:alcohol dehydrogenase catalytic domain-containing protein [Clostridia bacterium]HOB81390.1 alcohol dehydrogenase catalytic domain-containing protein [Peptococcaceae bacterium]HPZ71531.1 alcohol dehydrogenase catalytic domain-containing protein [Peptococcaceae bacterium]HQD53441.1 alcohol dehydrogenase catalytic domain-containing protein [Peptococcaceae bacterium]
MDAVVLRAPNEFEVEDVQKPACPEDGFVVKVMAVGLCGSDVRTFGFGHPKVTLPHIIGHEVTGIVDEAGAKTTEFKVGDRVLINPIIPCGDCAYCKMGLGNQCSNITVVGTQIPGGYAQYVAVPRLAIKNDCVLKLSDDLPFEYAPLAETAASVIAAQKYANVQEGDTVLVVGSGPIGCLHTEVAKIRGAKKVIMSEINDSRLDIARNFDAIDVFVNPTKENLKEAILRETDGLGVDVVICANPVGKTQEEAFSLVRARGKIIFFGGLPKDNCHITVDSNDVHYREIAIFGAYAYTQKEFQEAMDYIENGKLPAKKFVTHVLPLKEIKEGIDIIKKGLGIKVVLKPWEN